MQCVQEIFSGGEKVFPGARSPPLSYGLGHQMNSSERWNHQMNSSLLLVTDLVTRWIHLVTKSVTKRRASRPWKNFLSTWKNLLDILYAKSLFSYMLSMSNLGLLEKIIRPSGVLSRLRVCWWLLPCDFCQLCHSAQSFHNQIFQFWKDTKIYLRLNRNQKEQR